MEPVELHELAPTQAKEIWREFSERYEESLDYFEAGNFRKASSILSDVILENPNDGPSLQLMARVVEAMLNEGEDFDPVWKLLGK